MEEETFCVVNMGEDADTSCFCFNEFLVNVSL